MPRKKAAPKNTASFEQSLEQLESLVEALEDGDLPLEQALAHFEEGIALTRKCQSLLTDAEQKVRLLSEQAGEPTVEELDADELDD